ncbi:hypothetical protein HOY82DRAFT_606388 [Tuber indicum]|nr:hypothetical protein HOY82DRAFT_606388 [Tuber indicum]
MPTKYQDITLLQRHSGPLLRLENCFGPEPTQGTRWPTESITQPVLYPSYPASAQDELRNVIVRCRQPGNPASRGAPTPAPRKRRCPMAPVKPRADAGIESRWSTASITQPVLHHSYPARAQDELGNVIARCRQQGSPASRGTATPLETPATGGDSVMETRSGGYGLGDTGWVSLWTYIYGADPVAWDGGWVGTCGGDYGVVYEAEMSRRDWVRLETGSGNWVEDPVAMGTMDLEYSLQ